MPHNNIVPISLERVLNAFRASHAAAEYQSDTVCLKPVNEHRVEVEYTTPTGHIMTATYDTAWSDHMHLARITDTRNDPTNPVTQAMEEVEGALHNLDSVRSLLVEGMEAGEFNCQPNTSHLSRAANDNLRRLILSMVDNARTLGSVICSLYIDYRDNGRHGQDVYNLRTDLCAMVNAIENLRSTWLDAYTLRQPDADPYQ
jgi:hypothetical protein